MFRGHEPTGAGFIMGHEFTGTVVAAGRAVRTVQIGDKVVAPFTVSWYDTFTREAHTRASLSAP